MSWDPAGRGGSSGTEDVNGHRAQDDAASVWRWFAAHESVDSTAIVVLSHSFGGALAAGALGRHLDLQPMAWIDRESPGWWAEDLGYAPDFTRDKIEDLVAAESDPDAWWAEREPAGLMAQVRTPYHRLQGIPDHALGSYLGHAGAMLDASVAVPERTYNGTVIDGLPVASDTVRELAVGGSLASAEDYVLDMTLSLFDR